MNFSSAIMNELAEAVGLDKCPGFEPALSGDLFHPCVERWIELARENQIRPQVIHSEGTQQA